jgi:cyclic pyranopterin phosphate synthase
MLARREGVRDLAITTNGILLAEQARALHEAGLHRVTVSLDTLRPDRFRDLTRRDALDRVLAGIEAVGAAGFDRLKLDAVVMRGVNEDELVDLVEFGKRMRAEVRFIEYMDVGGATRWTPEAVVTRDEMLRVLGSHYGGVQPLVENSAAPAERFVLPDGTVFGIIASTTTPFCRSCDRSRLTADGMWYLCLYALEGVDLRRALRGGSAPEEIRAFITSTWRSRRDRGAEVRLETHARGALLTREGLRRDPHLEMHTRGG